MGIYLLFLSLFSEIMETTTSRSWSAKIKWVTSTATTAREVSEAGLGNIEQDGIGEDVNNVVSRW